MAGFTLYQADCLGNARNCLYPHAISVTDEASLRQAVSRDYVTVAYRNGRRQTNTFLSANCLAMDLDNDHSNDPKDWIETSDVLQAFPDTTIAFHYSRHHRKLKNGQAPRPRFHVFFRIDEMKDAAAYRVLKERVQAYFPYFDAHAMDAARFFFGTPNPAVEFHAGTMTLNECLDLVAAQENDAFAALPFPHDVIPEGRRNATLSAFAARVLKRLGNTAEARKAFDETAARCSPPMENAELQAIWNSALRFYKKIAAQAGYTAPETYAPPQADGTGWDKPIPFTNYTRLSFPIDAFPEDLARYVAAVAESTQTPVDMAGTMMISLLSVCMQGKYVIQGKDDWKEPLNTYCLVIALPSERKSAVLNMMVKPINDYEVRQNRINAASIENSRMRRRILERKQKTIEEQFAVGKATQQDLEEIAAQVAGFEEEQPLQLYVDDITTEKLVSVLSQNKGHAAMISSESGIFDTLSGTYSKAPNIDVMLKAYSGDTIRVDRIGRTSESIMNPALTILLMAQPNVVSAVMENPTFRGRGLTARFLYCVPASLVGSRRFTSPSVPPEYYLEYEKKVINLLEDEYPEKPEVIRLSDEARALLTSFAEEHEGRLLTDYGCILEWAGKLVGNTLRLAGLLCRASVRRAPDFLCTPEPLVVDGPTMANAIRLGKYYLNHALHTFDSMPEDDLVRQAEALLQMLRENKLTTFDRRTAMRLCRLFKTVGEIQPVLDFLEDYGYIMAPPGKPILNSAGRPALPTYLVNPAVHA